MALRNSIWKDKAEPKKGADRAAPKTRLVIKYDCGYPNTLTMRGTGAPQLSWDKGLPLKNIKADEWIFETDVPFGKIEFKVLINDTVYESGTNKTISHGTQMNHTPSF